MEPIFARRSENLIGSIIDASTSILADQSHDIVRFAMGAPDEALIPVAELDAALGTATPGRFDYGSSEGEKVLREQVLKLSAELGQPTRDERILITTGGMQGLDLAFKLFVDPGDLVVVEAPTYTNGIATALSYGAEVLPVPVDAGGMVVEALPELVERAGRTPRAIYTVPTFQNPSGVTMTRERRELLLELAERWGSTIIDDDPYGALRFEGERVPGFGELAPEHPLVFSVRTFSKIIAPGLRVGWIDADPKVRPLAINAKQAMDTCTQVPIQHAVARYLASGGLAAHLERLRPIYRERKIAMRAAVDELLPGLAETTDPDGGFFLWTTLTGPAAELDSRQLFEAGVADGVAFIPGPAFTSDASLTGALRLAYATETPERIREGVGRLAGTIDRALATAGIR